MNAPDIVEIIQKGTLEDLRKAIENHYADGMMSFDQCLFKLYQSKVITRDDALHFAESKTDLNLKMRLAESGKKSSSLPNKKQSDGPSFKTKL